jgi:hypothetical protein
METDFELFEGKSFRDLCRDIVTNQVHRKEQIETFIGDLRPMIKTINDAMQVVPLIKQYVDASISNDEHLVKLAQICQRIMAIQANIEANGGSYGLSEDEKKELMSTIDEIKQSDSVIIKTISQKKD